MAKSFLFAGTGLGGGGMLKDDASLAFAFSRAYASVTPGGVAVAAGTTARYWHYPRLLCGAAEVKEERGSSDGNFHIAHSGGVASDSTTPMMAYQAADLEKLRVYKSSLQSASPLLANQPTTFTLSGATYVIYSAHVCHGLMVCFATRSDPALGGEQSTSVWWWQELAPTFALKYNDTPTQVGKPRLSVFHCQGFRILAPDAASGNVLQAWIAWSDYVNNPGSTGGRFFLMKATRSSLTSPWSLGNVKMVYELPTGAAGNSSRHAHSPYVERFGTSGLRMVCPVGDAYGNNKVLCFYRTDENYEATTPASWTTPFDVHGIKGNTDPLGNPVGEGNQFVASAPHGYPDAPTGQVIGGDEVHHTISRIAQASNSTDKIVVQKLYGPTAAGINRLAQNRAYVFNCFRIACQDQLVGGGFAAQFAGGSQDNWDTRNEASRILYSPDGNYWGQCFPFTHSPITPVEFFGNRIVFGSNGNSGLSNRLRSIAVPAVTAQQPLVLSDGGTNVMEVTGPADGSVQAPNTAVLQTNVQVDALAGIRPPCAGPVYRVTSPNVSGAQRELGIWRITKDVAGDLIPANSKIKVRVWVYPLPWKGGSQPIAASTVLHVALGQYRNPSLPSPQPEPVAQMAASREEFSYNYGESGDPVRGWFPITVDTDTQAVGPGGRFWRDDAGSVADNRPTVPFPLGLRLTSRKNTSGEPANPCEFLIAFEHVSAGSTLQEYPGGPIPAGTTGNAEEATVSGFTCGNSWTIEMAGEVPDHC